MSHSAKVNSVISFHLLSSGASRTVQKPCLVEIFSLWLFHVSDFQRTSMALQSHLIPDPHIIFFFPVMQKYEISAAFYSEKAVWTLLFQFSGNPSICIIKLVFSTAF